MGAKTLGQLGKIKDSYILWTQEFHSQECIQLNKYGYVHKFLYKGYCDV